MHGDALLKIRIQFHSAHPYIDIVSFFLVSCAGRQPNPVNLVQHTDEVADCQQIMAEIKANNETISDLARDEGLKVTQNVAAGVAGLFIPVLWFGMEFQDAAGKEGKALSQRNEDLAGLAKKPW